MACASGGLYETLSPQRWLLHAGLIAAGGLVLPALRRPLRRALDG